MQWHVGDVAILCPLISEIHPSDTEAFKAVGRECILLRKVVDDVYCDWVVDCGLEDTIDTAEKWLKPLPDGNQASAWNECAFKPKELVA